jgi:hypothetical protein
MMNLNRTSALTAAGILALAVMGCGSVPLDNPKTEGPKPELQFVDLQGFDRDLGASLSAPLPSVNIAFLDRVTPTAIPPRLQTWMAAVEGGGGKVSVVPPGASSPPGSGVTPKSPLLLIGAITSLWSASKMANELSGKQNFSSAKAYDANIILKHDEKGEAVVEKIVFLQKKPKL